MLLAFFYCSLFIILHPCYVVYLPLYFVSKKNIFLPSGMADAKKIKLDDNHFFLFSFVAYIKKMCDYCYITWAGYNLYINIYRRLLILHGGIYSKLAFPKRLLYG